MTDQPITDPGLPLSALFDNQPTDHPRLTEEAQRTGRCSQCGAMFAERACGPTHAVARKLWFGEAQVRQVDLLRQERDAAIAGER